MRRILLSATAIGLVASAATAADLPSRRAPPVYVAPPVPVFTWTGFYIGGNAGYGFSSRDTETTTSDGSAIAQGQLNAGTVPTSHQLRRNGFTGGGQIGYNYQFGPGLGGNIVVGVEADAAYMDSRHNDTIVIPTFNTRDAYRSRLDYLGTVRGRIGVAFDRILLYGTGGFAYGDTSYAHDFLSNTATPFAIFSGARRGMQTGYAVGGGVEYALPTGVFGASTVTLRAEYLYYDLGARTTTLGFFVPTIASNMFDRYRTAGSLVRGGINFKFGEPVAPVVARY